MKIQKLKLCNFSSYEGENEFDFATNDINTVVLIGGQNGAGKTSLFTAIKIALYGSLSFGYTGMNSYYFKRIKEQINTKAFQNDVLQAFVSIEIAVKREREMKYYTITRRWYTEEKKMNEEYTIAENGKLLSEMEKTYFENYLYSTLPPNLFDFFLFDGEEVGKIFASEGYHNYVKDAMLTLCGMDVFSAIRKFCGSFIDKKAFEKVKPLQKMYQNYQEQLQQMETAIHEDEARQKECFSEIERLQSEIEAIESKFVIAGGIPDAQLQEMRTQEATKEKKRSVLLGEIKDFMEGALPFFLMKDMIKPLEIQIQYEEKLDIYEYVGNMITPEFLQNQLDSECHSPEQTSEKLYQAILHKIAPKIEETSQERILDLSRDEISLIDRTIETVQAVQPDKMIAKIKERNQYTNEIIAIHQKLRETLTEEDARKYRFQQETAKAQVQTLQAEITVIENRLSNTQKELDELQAKIAEIYQQILDNAQNQHIYELSGGIARIMQKLIDQKTASIREQLAERTLQNLNEIYRKDNLISKIEIEESFQIHLYQKQDFTLQELQSLLANVGTKDFLEQMGTESIHILKEHFQVYENQELIADIRATYQFDGVFHLYQQIDLSRLSKGERQIFILSLYWAMIQISEKEIPFIIDTPYARIDATHREEISQKFFPQISSQVIILSTDEEITEEYYHILKPHIAQEYLLSNQQGENRTTIEKRYFFEVKS